MMKKVCMYCGAKNDADAHFCEKCGSQFERIGVQDGKTNSRSKQKDDENIPILVEETEKFKVASSDKRFWAWIIDAFISWGFLTFLVGLAGYMYGDPFLFRDIIFFYEESFIFGIGSLGLVSFLYFVILEYFIGTTIGKSAMNLSVISKSGNKPSFLAIIVNSIGKSFAFVFDVFAAICFVHYEEDEVNLEQRVFQALAGVVVIETPKNDYPSRIIFSSS
ncbi:MAG: RDD family protein [Candidatus Hodarchaeales archaeon]|jgi:uncharacterized RDD family membrane protein YckC